jgi:hypothetical protein
MASLPIAEQAYGGDHGKAPIGALPVELRHALLAGLAKFRKRGGVAKSLELVDAGPVVLLHTQEFRFLKKQKTHFLAAEATVDSMQPEDSIHGS